jgi:hypothetical protein
VTIVTASRRSAYVGIQKLKRIANGANASPTTEDQPMSAFVAPAAEVTKQAYALLLR